MPYGYIALYAGKHFQFAQLRNECTSVRRNKSIIAVMAAGSIKKHYEVKQSKM